MGETEGAVCDCLSSGCRVCFQAQAGVEVFSCSLGYTHPSHSVFTRTKWKDLYLIRLSLAGWGLVQMCYFFLKAPGKEELISFF